jgi:hypothetical protein
MSPLTTKGT